MCAHRASMSVSVDRPLEYGNAGNVIIASQEARGNHLHEHLKQMLGSSAAPQKVPLQLTKL